MGSVIVRNLDEETISALKDRAAQQGSSLEQFLRDRLAELAKPTRAEFLTIAAEIRARTPFTGVSVVEDIRAWRDNLDDDGKARD